MKLREDFLHSKSTGHAFCSQSESMQIGRRGCSRTGAHKRQEGHESCSATTQYSNLCLPKHVHAFVPPPLVHCRRIRLLRMQQICVSRWRHCRQQRSRLGKGECPCFRSQCSAGDAADLHAELEALQAAARLHLGRSECTC